LYQQTIDVYSSKEMGWQILIYSLQQNASQIEAASAGVIPGLSRLDILNQVIPIPINTSEQCAIATALSDVDALIASLDRLIAKKHDIKQAAMQELLTGKRRLPGFSRAWETRPLGEVAPLQRGFDLPTSMLQHGPYPVVYSNGVLNHHSAFQAKGPGVVTGRSGTIGKVTFVQQDFWPHNTTLWVTSFKGNNPRFVSYLYTRIGLDRFATGSGVPTLNRNDVHAFKVRIPTTNNEQTAIASVLSNMDAEITSLEARREKTRALKQGMMQELLTGRIRLVKGAEA
jgi:type I restriction enzyme S subunit